MEADQPAVSFQSASAAETERLAERLARALPSGSAITLAGPLGAGKTCFVRGMAKGLGVDPRTVSSPTFVVVNEYERRSDGGGSGAASESDRACLIHVDAYRLSGPEELDTLGWDEILADSDCVLAIEWPERIGEALPAKRIDVRIDHGPAGERLISIWGDAAVLNAAFGSV